MYSVQREAFNHLPNCCSSSLLRDSLSGAAAAGQLLSQELYHRQGICYNNMDATLSYKPFLLSNSSAKWKKESEL